jgi:hypothetical protein
VTNMLWAILMVSFAFNFYMIVEPFSIWLQNKATLLRGHWRIKRMQHAGEILGPTSYKGNLILSVKEAMDMQMLATGEDLSETVNRALKLFTDLEAERRAGTQFWAERNNDEHLEELKWR